jgi:glycosyltransferase involved in cell wall biosynthesis
VPTDAIVVPHGISEEFYKPSSITDPNLRAILELKKEKNLRFVLFHLAHSSYRKGADLFVKAMSIVQARRPNVVVLLKTCELVDPYVYEVKKLKHIQISKTLPLDVYVQLYDVADVVVLTSRGGAFECVALEGIARGKPTIVPNAGCFLDYVEYTIPVEVTDARPTVLEGNPIHVGRGWEVDVHDLADKIVEVVDHYDEYREKFDEYAEEVRRKYSWKRIVKNFVVELSKRSLIEITTKPYESRITLRGREG